MRRIKGQSIAEYALILAIASMVFTGMNIYVKRALQSRYKAGTDYVLRAVGQNTAPRQYEPYYSSETTDVESQSLSRDIANEDGSRAKTHQEIVSSQVVQTTGIGSRAESIEGPLLSPPFAGVMDAVYDSANRAYRIGFSFTYYPVTLRLVIKNTLGRVVRTMDNLYSGSDSGEIVWDCHDDLGRPVTQGQYSFELTAEYKAEGYSPYTTVVYVTKNYNP